MMGIQFNNTKKLLAVAGVAIAAQLAVASQSFADCSAFHDAGDLAACEKYETALQLFGERDVEGKNDQAIALLDEALGQVKNRTLRYDVLILSSRAYYWKGLTVPGPEDGNVDKRDPYYKGYQKALEAKQINGRWVDSHYFASINLGKWGVAMGVGTVLGRLQELKNFIAACKAENRKTRDGRPGVEIDSFGPLRVEGRMKHVTPLENRQQAVDTLKAAYENAPKHALNVVYYAMALQEHAKDTAKATALLQELVKEDPMTMIPERAPEARMEIRYAQYILDHGMSETGFEFVPSH